MLLRGEIDSRWQWNNLAGCWGESIARPGRAGRNWSRFSGTVPFLNRCGLEPYYAYSATQTAEAGAFFVEPDRRDPGREADVVHGDFSPKNILVRNHGLVLLDHEVIHWGDPAFDLGFSLTHF